MLPQLSLKNRLEHIDLRSLAGRLGPALVVLAGLLAVSSAAPPAAAMRLIEPLEAGVISGPATAVVEPEVWAAFNATDRVEVVVLLNDGEPVDAPDDRKSAAVAKAQSEVLADLPAGDFEVMFRPQLVPVLTGWVTPMGLKVLERHPRVVVVEYNDLNTYQLEEAVPLIGAPQVWEEYGLTGEGITVAVLDTGIDNDHPDFEGRILDQRCYSSSRSCAPNNTPQSDNAEDEHGHGTAVTGIIASNGAVSHKGVAPDAGILALRVFRDTGGASNADIIAGLDYALRKQHELNVKVVNMSLGGGSGIGVNCDGRNPTMKATFQSLVARGVSIFVATGNDGLADRVSAPACISNSIAVGATYDAEYDSVRACPAQGAVTPMDIACFTNRGRAMDILAPGIWIAASGLNGGQRAPGAGTSFAAPMAAGLGALMLQADDDLRSRDVEKILKDTGIPVPHPEGDDITPRINAVAAIRAVLPETPTPEPTTPATPTPTATATATVEPPTVTPTPGDGTDEPTESPTPDDQPTTPPPSPTSDGAQVHIYLPRVLNGQ